ncbi:MAG: hypothetical protein IJ516_05610 [Phascolarctobacterium sp.]|nr:hypothetical protein [Phascolarctobacterium sp.]
MPGNYEAMAAWNAIKNCMRYAVGMNGMVMLGVSWQDAGYVLDKMRFRVNALLMRKLQRLEEMAITSQGKEGRGNGKERS